jgi:gluconokinase
LIAERLQGRKNHFASISLLESQLLALEPPAPEEHAIELDVVETPAALVAKALEMLGAKHLRSE